MDESSRLPSSYHPSIHRLDAVAKAFDAEVIQMLEEPDYPPHTVF